MVEEEEEDEDEQHSKKGVDGCCIKKCVLC